MSFNGLGKKNSFQAQSASEKEPSLNTPVTEIEKPYFNGFGKSLSAISRGSSPPVTEEQRERFNRRTFGLPSVPF